MNRFSSHRALLILAVLAMAIAFPSCQSGSTDAADPVPTSERTKVVASYTIKKNEPFKKADSLTWSAPSQSGAGLVPQLSDSNGTYLKYSASLQLKTPLKDGILNLSLWSHGIRFLQAQFNATGTTDTLQIISGSAKSDSIALLLLHGLDSLKGTLPQTREGLLTLYGTWILAGDARIQGFPDSLPVGLSATEVIQATLVTASKSGKTLVEQAKTWRLGITTDSATSIVLKLIQSKTIASKDSSTLFPPPPVRLDKPLTVGNSLLVGGEPVPVGGSFVWDKGLTQATIRAYVLQGGASVKASAIIASSLPVPAASATHASLDSASTILIATTLAQEGEYQLVVVAQAGNDSAKATATFLVGPKASVQAGAPKVRLVSPTDSSSVPFETSEVLTTWVVTTPQGSIDKVTLDGNPASKKSDSTWAASVKLEPTGKPQTVVLRARNTDSIWATEVVHLTRLADLTGPVVTWMSPTADLEVENGVASITVKIKATDPSGIDTVLIAGAKPDSLTAAGEYVRKVPLTVVGSPQVIVVRVVDSAKNPTTSFKSITRANPATDVPPKAILLEPSSKTGTVVPFETKSVTARWAITDPYGIDSASVTINGKPAKSEGGDKWSAVVDLIAGGPTTILLAVKNKNGISGGDVASVTRQADTTRPALSWVLGGRSVGFDSSEVSVSIKASDNDSLVSVTIGGLVAEGDKDVYAARLKLEVGDNPVTAVATDRTGLRDTIRSAVHRYQKVSITRIAPSRVDTTVGSGVGSVALSWKVVGAKSVGVGDSVLSRTGDAYTWTVNLPGASTRVVLWALDSAGKRDSTEVAITRRGVAALTLSYGEDTLSTLPDSVVIKAVSEAGATLAWSLDGTTWTAFTGSFVQKASGTAQVRAQVSGKEDAIASLKAFSLHSYPVANITREASTKDSSVASTVTSIGVAWKVTGAKTVKIADQVVTSITNVFTSSVALVTGVNPVKIEATDSAGRTVSDVVTITRRSMATLTLSYGADTLATLPDSVVIKAVSEAGAVLSWSLDGKTWTVFTGSFVQKVSGAAQVRSQVAGKDDTIATWKAHVLYHTNHAPSFAIKSTDLILQNYNRDSILPNFVTGETAHEGLQYIAKRRVELIGAPADTVLTGVPSLDAWGNVSIPRRPNLRGWFRFRITILDNGGTEHGGIDSATKDFRIFFGDTIIDASDNSVYRYVVLGKRAWFAEDLRKVPRWGQSDVAAKTVTGSYLYDWAQAFDLDSTDCFGRNCSEQALSVHRGLCPAGWSIPDSIEWRLMVDWAAQGGTDSQAVVRLKSRTGWGPQSYGLGSIFLNPGTDQWGFALTDNYGGSDWRAGKYWAKRTSSTGDASGLDQVAATFMSAVQSGGQGYSETFSVFSIQWARYHPIHPVRCIKSLPPGQWR